MMRAIKVSGDTLSWEAYEAPSEVPENHVAIDIAWTAINRADLMQKAGVYPPPPGASDIPGLEAAGTADCRSLLRVMPHAESKAGTTVEKASEASEATPASLAFATGSASTGSAVGSAAGRRPGPAPWPRVPGTPGFFFCGAARKISR